MVLRAKHNFIIHHFFRLFTRWKMKTVFHQVNLIGKFEDKKKAVLVISNHISWWDGFWIMYLNIFVLLRKFHFMMLEEQLRKYWFFNYTGGFSVNKNSRSIIESLNYSTEILQDKNNMLMIFPQGEIESMHKSEFLFEKGIERIIKNSQQEIQILFVANMVDYFSQPKPSVSIYYEECLENNRDVNSLQKAYQHFYKQKIEKQITIKNLK